MEERFLKIFTKILRSHNGSTLPQTLILSSMVMIMGLTTMRMAENQAKQNQSLVGNVQAVAFAKDLQQLLANADVCKNTLSAGDATIPIKNEVELTKGVLNASGNSIISLHPDGQDAQEKAPSELTGVYNGIQFEKLRVLNFQSFPGELRLQKVFLEVTTKVYLRNEEDNKRTFTKYSKNNLIPIYLLTDDNKIVTCQSKPNGDSLQAMIDICNDVGGSYDEDLMSCVGAEQAVINKIIAGVCSPTNADNCTHPYLSRNCNTEPGSVDSNGVNFNNWVLKGFNASGDFVCECMPRTCPNPATVCQGQAIGTDYCSGDCGTGTNTSGDCAPIHAVCGGTYYTCAPGDPTNGDGTHWDCMGQNGGDSALACSAGSFIRIFASSKNYTGNIGGINGGNIECKQLATGAGLTNPNDFHVILETTRNSPNMMFNDPNPVKNIKGDVVYTSLSDMLSIGPTDIMTNPIAYDETGAAIAAAEIAWFGGKQSFSNCANFSSNDVRSHGGVPTNATWWRGSWFNDCTFTNKIYCTDAKLAKINGTCGREQDQCLAGLLFNSQPLTGRWGCQGSNGGFDAYCKRSKAVSGDIIFVSSSSYTSNLGGIAGADAKCNSLASAVPTLAAAGPFRAMLSTSSQILQTRFTDSDPLFNTQGDLIANDYADLFSNHRGGVLFNAIKYNESGNDVGAAEVWTGSKTAHCQSWNVSGDDEEYGSYGRGDHFTSTFLSLGNTACDNSARRIYCTNADLSPSPGTADGTLCTYLSGPDGAGTPNCNTCLSFSIGNPRFQCNGFSYGKCGSVGATCSADSAICGGSPCVDE